MCNSSRGLPNPASTLPTPNRHLSLRIPVGLHVEADTARQFCARIAAVTTADVVVIGVAARDPRNHAQRPYAPLSPVPSDHG